MAARLAELVDEDPDFELTAPARFGLVCFRPRGGADADSEALLERVNASGRAFLVHTKLDGQHVIRFAIGGLDTQWRHVKATWKLIKQTWADMARR